MVMNGSLYICLYHKQVFSLFAFLSQRIVHSIYSAIILYYLLYLVPTFPSG